MRQLLTILAAATLTTPVHAQIHPPDPLLAHLIGHWVLRGPMAGAPVVHDVTFRWVLDSEYIEMHEVSRERTRAGTPAYEAIVYLVRDPKTHEYAALWLDNTAAASFGQAGVGHAKARGDSIAFVFEDSPSSRFHNTFIYDRASDTWAWHMDNDSAGVRKMFARVTLKRE